MESGEAWMIPTDGPAVTIERLPTLERVQSIVGGWVERVPCPGGVLYCNEEGLLKGLELNMMASYMTGRQIVGPVVIIVKDGETDE